MKNNKLISTLLALLVCLSLVVSASASSESELTFTLESSDSFMEALGTTVANTGDTITVTLNIANNPGILYARGFLTFDTAALKLTNTEVTEGAKVIVNEGEVIVTLGDIRSAVIPSKDAVPFTATGTVVTLTFEVLAKEDTVSTIALSVSDKDVIDTKNGFSVTSKGAEMNVNVVGENHKCDAYETVEADNSVEATCTTEGKETDILCAHCGKVVTEGAVIPAMEHSWGEGVITTEPTCNTFGVRTYTCANCGETKVDDKVPYVEHKWGEYVETKPATVDTEGVETSTCSVCGETRTRSIEKLPAEPVAPAEKSNTGLIIAIVVVVVLAGAGVAAYFVLKNKKK